MEKIKKVQEIIGRQFPMEKWKDQMKDTRKEPEISVGTIAQVIAEMVPRGQKSLLEVDQDGRLPEMKAWHESKREMVVSDSTVIRCLEGIELSGVHQPLWETALKMMEREMMKVDLPSGKKMRVGIVDGSQWGNDLGSVLILAGRRVDIVAGYKMSPGRGHELDTTRKLLDEAIEKLGKGFTDLVAVDGLYVTKEDFEKCRDQVGAHLIVKSKEEKLTVIQDAKQLFYGNPQEFADSLEIVKGIDQERGVKYEITAAPGFEWQGIRLKVAHVREEFLKPKAGHSEKTQYWVITTDESLSAEDMREVVILRWHIENLTFRRLSHLVGSKRRMTNNVHVREALLGLWFIGLNLTGLTLAWTRMTCTDPLRQSFSEARSILQTAKKTWKMFCKLFHRATTLFYVQSLVKEGGVTS